MLRGVGLDDFGPEIGRQTIHVFDVEIKPERIASGDQPAFDRRLKVQGRPIWVRKDKIFAIIARDDKPQPLIKGAAGLKVIAWKNRG